jgi:hypothetical protein
MNSIYFGSGNQNYGMNNNEDAEVNEKISLDELYDRKHQVQLHRLGIYRKILNRVHTKIKMIARQKINNDYLFYIVPEVIFGFPKYNLNECIAFLIEKLQENGFNIKYTHPNLLFISWNHYIPAYEREKIKEMTGKTIDGFGNVIKDKNNNNNKQQENIFNLNNNNNQIQLPHKLSNMERPKEMYNLKYNPSIYSEESDKSINMNSDMEYYNNKQNNNSNNNNNNNNLNTKYVKFRDISSYKPKGIYNKELIEIINNKFK